jgi:hypothetical protein
MGCSFLLKFYCGNPGFRFLHFVVLDPEGKSDEDDLSPRKLAMSIPTWNSFQSFVFM